MTDSNGTQISEYRPGWIRSKRGDSLAVFVHGINSDSNSTWRDADKPGWPTVLSEDPEFDSFSILLAEYHTQISSPGFGFGDASAQLVDFFDTEKNEHGLNLYDYRRIVFICHSAGGIVVRHLLTTNLLPFQNKSILLLLVASPSLGSDVATKVQRIPFIGRHLQARQLSRTNDWLRDLDARFRELRDNPQSFIAAGKEILEDRNYDGFRGLAGRVVDIWSGNRYFLNATIIPGSDHSSISKPSSRTDPAHRALRSLVQHDQERHETSVSDPLVGLWLATFTYLKDTQYTEVINISRLPDGWYEGQIAGSVHNYDEIRREDHRKLLRLRGACDDSTVVSGVWFHPLKPLTRGVFQLNFEEGKQVLSGTWCQTAVGTKHVSNVWYWRRLRSARRRTFGVFGITGAGKTTLCKTLSENQTIYRFSESEIISDYFERFLALKFERFLDLSEPERMAMREKVFHFLSGRLQATELTAIGDAHYSFPQWRRGRDCGLDRFARVSPESALKLYDSYIYVKSDPVIIQQRLQDGSQFALRNAWANKMSLGELSDWILFDYGGIEDYCRSNQKPLLVLESEEFETRVLQCRGFMEMEV